MTTRTMTINKGTGGGTDYTPGWKELTISKADYGDYNGTKYLDVSFKGYPDNFTARIYTALDKNGEEFAIGQVFRFANAGITGGLEGPNGTKIMKMDDDPINLEGKIVNGYFYKDGKYSRVLKQFAPTVFENEVESFSEADVIYWKGRAENYYEKYVRKSGTSDFNSTPPVTTDTDSADIPF
jgi:hypothetical protein